MEFYIEYAIIDNLLIDYLLLKESAVVLKLKTRRLFLLLAAAVGTAFAIIFPLIKLHAVVSFVLKISCAFLMCFIAVRHRNVRSFLFYFNVFLLFTFVTGGAITGIIYLSGINEFVQAYYQARALPIGVAAALIYLSFIAVKKFAVAAAAKAITVCGLIDCEIVIKGVRFKAKAFFDSGNFLTDKRTGLPVAVVGKSFYAAMVEKVFPVRHGEIAVAGAGSRWSLKTFKTDYVIIRYKGKTFAKDAVLAVGDEPTATGADMLIGKAMLLGFM